MDNEIFEYITHQTTEVSKLFKINRKKICASINEQIDIISSEYNKLQEYKKTVSKQLEDVTKKLSKLEKNYVILKNKNNEQKNTINELEKIKIKLSEQLDNISKKLSTCENKIEKLNNENNIHKKTIEHLRLENNDIMTKLDLISRILSAKSIDNDDFNKFKELIYKDFIDFANKEKSLPEEANAILQLQAVEKQIEIILNFLGVYNKNIIAVGGGFSAGKSEFISSFFKDDDIRLPIGIKPVTAIPTYITSGKKNKIKGYTQKGGLVDITPDLFKKISHNFVKSFSFNLKDIMPIMAVETPFYFDNICFIDTPGYNPPGTKDGFTEEDMNTAKEYLERANVLLWLIGLDNSGTIPDSDIEFLDELSLEHKSFYVIANKADLKSKDDIEQIIDNFEETLSNADIAYMGISAYSSIDREEITYRKIPLMTFLDKQNSPVEVHKQVINDLNKIFDLYETAIKKDIEYIKTFRKEFKSLELDILELNYEKYDESNAVNRLQELKKQFDIKEYEKRLKELKTTRKNVIDTVCKIFNNTM